MDLVEPTRTLRPSKRWRIEAYLATGVGLLGVTATADAGIVTINLTSAGTDGVDITGDNGGLGTPAYGSGAQTSVSGFFPNGSGTSNNLGIFAWGYSTSPAYRAGFAPSGGLMMAITAGYASPQVFQLNDEIGPGGSLNWSEDSRYTAFTFTDASYNDYKKDSFLGGYIGFRATVGADYYYGWMQVDWNNTAGYGGVFNILAAAYEDSPNTLIRAGDVGGSAAVPEPASSAVAALLMGGTALRHWRKKRREAASETLAS